jgi:hypothetical protein
MGEVINDTSKAYPNETVPHQVSLIQYHNDPNHPIRPRNNLTIENSNSSSGTNVSSAQNGTRFEVINTDQTPDAGAEVAYLSHLAALKYTHDKNTIESTGSNNAGWKRKSRNSTTRSRNLKKRAELYSNDQAVWDAAQHVVTQAKYHRYLEGPGMEYEVPGWMMTPLYHAVQEYLLAQNPDGDKREITETAYNKVYLEVGDKKIVEEQRKKGVQSFRDFAVRYDDQEPWPEAENSEMLIKVVEPTPIPATTEVRTETTTEMATQTVTVQKLQTVTVCETETVTDRKTQSIVMCKIETVTEKKTQTTTVEIPRNTTLHPAPTSTPYFHKGPGKIAVAAEPETLSQEINNMSESINNSTSTSKVEDDEEKDQPAPTAAFRSQNGPGKIVNGTTPETTQWDNSTKEINVSDQARNFHPNDITIQDANTSKETPQDRSESNADLDKTKLLSFLNDLAKGVNKTASSISEQISKWSSNHH